MNLTKIIHFFFLYINLLPFDKVTHTREAVRKLEGESKRVLPPPPTTIDFFFQRARMTRGSSSREIPGKSRVNAPRAPGGN